MIVVYEVGEMCHAEPTRGKDHPRFKPFVFKFNSKQTAIDFCEASEKSIKNYNNVGHNGQVSLLRLPKRTVWININVIQLPHWTTAGGL